MLERMFAGIQVKMADELEIMSNSEETLRLLALQLEDFQRAGVSYLPDLGWSQIITELKSTEPNSESPSQPASHQKRAPASRPENQIDSRPTPAAPAEKRSNPPQAAPMPIAEPIQRIGAEPDPSAPSFIELPDHSDSDRLGILNQLNDEVRACQSCPALVANRSQTVFGVGPVRPRLCFFGEAPGADEDRQGEPFVGKAGQLLNKIIGAMGITRDDVYILNSIKCRPPGNRNPEGPELECCRQYWVRQLEILRPEFICCLGGVAANALLDQKETVGRLRRRWHLYRGAKVIVTYHPAYLLRNEFAKRYAWEDIKTLMAEMGLEVKKK